MSEYESEEMTELRNNLKQLKNQIEIFLEFISDHSQLLKNRYDELIKAGFSEEQAFEIVKEKGINLS